MRSVVARSFVINTVVSVVGYPQELFHAFVAKRAIRLLPASPMDAIPEDCIPRQFEPQSQYSIRWREGQIPGIACATQRERLPSTKGKTLADFQDRHWIEREAKTYQLTELGEFVADQFEAFTDAMAYQLELRGIWPWLPHEIHGFTLDWVTN